MNQVDEVKQWVQGELWPNIVKSGKLKRAPVSGGSGAGAVRVVDIFIRPIGADEAFMLTNCYKVKVVYECETKEDTCSLIVKKTPEVSIENYEAVNFDSLFHNEIAGYSKVIPALLDFVNPELEDLNFLQYYYSYQTPTEACIVIEDFEPAGWRMAKQVVNLSLEHILLAVRQIGKFHGLGYALKATDRNKFDSLTGLLKESRYAGPLPPAWEAVAQFSVQRVKNAADKFPGSAPTHFLDKLYQFLSNSYAFSKRLVQPVEPLATLCHGDFLRNNIAYKYSNQDPDLPTAALMFDLQTLRYSSPMVDISVLMSLSTGKDLRSLHFDEIFDEYHRNLASTYANHTSGNIPAFLSKSELRKEYVRFLPFALGIVAYFLPTLHEPDGLSAAEKIDIETEEEVLKQDILDRGGDHVDAEIAALVNEVYEFAVKENVDIFKNFIE